MTNMRGDAVKQSKLLSFVESGTNAVIGLAVSWAFTYFALPLFGLIPTPAVAGWITLCYFILSMGRAYILRRIFDTF